MVAQVYTHLSILKGVAHVIQGNWACVLDIQIRKDETCMRQIFVKTAVWLLYSWIYVTVILNTPDVPLRPALDPYRWVAA